MEQLLALKEVVMLVAGVVLAGVARYIHGRITRLEERVDGDQERRLDSLEQNVTELKVAANPALVSFRLESMMEQLLAMEGKMDEQQAQTLAEIRGIRESVVRIETLQQTQDEDLKRAHTKISALRVKLGEVAV